MKTIHATATSVVTTMMLSFLFLPLVFAQESEKQKILNVVNGELESFSNKERARWESYWAHSNAVKRFNLSSEFYGEILGWDSLSRAVNEYFASPGEGYKATKGSFEIRVEGNIAIVHMDEIASDKSMLKETLILERHGMEWKILEMYILSKSSYDASDERIEANLNTEGYNLLNKNKIHEAVKVFTLNTELFPAAYNTWDSLAEAYLKLGNIEKAIEYYQKSLNLNPKNDNARKYLAQLKK